MSDPVVEIWDQETSHPRTDIVKNNLNPVFHRAIDFIYPVLVSKKMMKENPQHLVDVLPPVVIDVMDVDSKLTGNQFEDIGRAVIYLKDSCCRVIKAIDENDNQVV